MTAEAVLPAPAGWTGSWVCDALGVRVVPVAGGLVPDVRLLVGLALRRNPRRPHLLVSTVLGKHVPTDPRLVRSTARLLGLVVAEVLGRGVPDRPLGPDAEVAHLLRSALRGEPGAVARFDAAVEAAVGDPAPAVAAVLGYAETATGLSHEVAEVLRAPHLHSTRRRVPGARTAAGFDEEHSHATGHLLLPDEADVLGGPPDGTDRWDAPLVLVDDELSTGRTVHNTVRALHALRPRSRYVVAALVDVRDETDRAATQALAQELGVRIDVASLARGLVVLPVDASARAQQLVAAHEREQDRTAPTGDAGGVGGVGELVDLGAAGWPVGVRETARHGLRPRDAAGFDAAARAVASTVAEALRAAHGGGVATVAVLGDEELMAAPARIAWHLGRALADAGTTVRFSSTTRSPVVAVAEEGYAVRSVLTFGSHDAPLVEPGDRYAYNVAPPTDAPTDAASDAATAPPSDAPADVVVLVTDAAADTPPLREPGGLLPQLMATAATTVVVRLPTDPPAPAVLRGPGFGSYAPAEVGWLLEDLSHVELEAPLEQREAAIRSGTAHYAESLPVEYQPDEGYRRLFHASLEASAGRVARAVGVVTELVLTERGHDVVLASLARAGTPVGILVRRWAALRHSLDLPHYAMSIVRGRGVDEVALDLLRIRHGASRVVFVDGWTGKGAIVTELRAAVAGYNAAHGLVDGDGFDAALAVLADPGRCVEVYGTREDFLIPSACLNSTVSGLVSRTVLNQAYLRPGGFHGAKFYAELADQDVSGVFVDAVTARFDDVREQVRLDLETVRGSDRTPTFSGWRAVEAIGRAHGMDDVNLIKPGVGETTRVLLRRVPWKVLVNPAAAADLEHVLYLAAERGVAVEEVPDLPYSCVGLIHPGHARAEG